LQPLARAAVPELSQSGLTEHGSATEMDAEEFFEKIARLIFRASVDLSTEDFDALLDLIETEVEFWR
jgi:hypothetical protein